MTHARLALGATLAAGLALGSAASAAPPPARIGGPAAVASATPTASPTASPSPIAYRIRPSYFFDVHVNYVNYPYAYANANNYVQCRIDSGPYFYGDDLGEPLLKPSPAATGVTPPPVSYVASTLVHVNKSAHNTVPEYPTGLTYSCTLFTTNAAGAAVYFPSGAPVGPGSRLYVTGPVNPRATKINVVQLLVLDGVGATPLPVPKARVTPTPAATFTPTPGV